LRLTLTWSDTLHSSQAGGPGGAHTFTIIRSWRVARLFDSAGTRLAELSASGDVHYRDGWWADSAVGSYAAIDVSGPVTEHALLSITAGQLVERSWSMNLTGRGTHPSVPGI